MSPSVSQAQVLRDRCLASAGAGATCDPVVPSRPGAPAGHQAASAAGGALGPQAALRQEQTLPVLRRPRPKSPGLSGRVVSATSRSTWLRGALGHVVWRRLRLLATRGSLKSDAEWLGL